MEVELVTRFAESIDSRVVWREGDQGELFEAMERGELDVVVCGLTLDTPWAKRIGMTQSYSERDGRKHVMATPRGENRWLLELDRFLQSPDAQAVASEGRP